LPVLRPSLSEQRAIAGFLDRETERIDTLIAKKERLIELLQEKRTALISHAVTKGLNPEVPMQDSGVEWLGEVPAHWDVMRLKYISPKLSVGVVVNPSHYYADEGVPFLFGSDISEGEISLDNARRISEESNRELSKSRLNAGDLAMVRVGDPGVTAVIPPDLDGANCASMMIIRQSLSFISQWLCYAMNSHRGRAQIDIVEYGAAQKQFNISHAVDFIYPVPPREEQASIAVYLDRETARIDVLADKIQATIDKLREHRTALISAAVTGKIDVREEVAA
ncbi:MAG: restriction endonuclease subunit S, partial [Anaerolineae bacterium]